MHGQLSLQIICTYRRNTEQLLKHIRSFLEKNIYISNDYWENNSIKYYLKYICSH